MGPMHAAHHSLPAPHKCRSERVAGIDAPNYNENARLLALAEPTEARDRRLMRGAWRLACRVCLPAYSRAWQLCRVEGGLAGLRGVSSAAGTRERLTPLTHRLAVTHYLQRT